MRQSVVRSFSFPLWNSARSRAMSLLPFQRRKKACTSSHLSSLIAGETNPTAIPSVAHLYKCKRHLAGAESLPGDNSIVHMCIDRAMKLSPLKKRYIGGEALEAEYTSVFVECAQEIEREDEASKTMVRRHCFYCSPLSGIVVAVNDCIDVKGFQTRYGLKLRMLHEVPKSDHPFVGRMRSAGAAIVGKLRPRGILGYEECTMFRSSNANQAIANGCCHYGFVSSLVGGASLGAPIAAEKSEVAVVGFKPSIMALPTVQYRFAMSQSLGIVARTIFDLHLLWIIMSRESCELEEKGKRCGTNCPVHGGATADQIVEEEEPTEKLVVVDDYANDGDLYREFEDPDASKAVLTVGVPVMWFTQSDPEEGHKRSAQFVAALEQRGKGLLKVVEINLAPLNTTETVKLARTVANYEVYTTIKGAYPGGTVVEELPELIVSAVYAGSQIPEHVYTSAKQCINPMRSEIDKEFRDVDVICLPTLSPPYTEGSIRSVVNQIPFVLCGYPIVSLNIRIGEEHAPNAPPLGPILVVGELGRDTGLLEDSSDLCSILENGKLVSIRPSF